MSNSYYFALLVKRKDLSHRISDIFSYNSPNTNKDYMESWFPKAISIDLEELITRCRKIETSQKPLRTELLSSDVSSLGIEIIDTRQKLILSIEGGLQGFFGDDDDVFVWVIYKENTTQNREHNYEATLLLKKLVQLLKPKYGWMMTESLIGEFRGYSDEGKSIIVPDPWNYYSSTRIVGADLQKKLGLDNLDWSNTPEVFHADVLDDVLWLSGPSGLGNENLHIRHLRNFLSKEDKYDSGFYRDPALARLLRIAQTNHDSFLKNYFGSKLF